MCCCFPRSALQIHVKSEAGGREGGEIRALIECRKGEGEENGIAIVHINITEERRNKNEAAENELSVPGQLEPQHFSFALLSPN